MCPSGRGRYYNASDHLSSLDGAEGHRNQAVIHLDEGEEWLLGRAVFPHDSLVGTYEGVMVSFDPPTDHVVLC